MIKQKAKYSRNSSGGISFSISDNASVHVELKVTTMDLPNDGKKTDTLCLYGIARDVTERNSLHEQLHQAQKMEAIGTLPVALPTISIIFSWGSRATPPLSGPPLTLKVRNTKNLYVLKTM